jgi:hypothetical protein
VLKGDSREQPLVAFSTVEAEYIGASDAAKEAIWIRNLFADITLRNSRESLSNTDPQLLYLANQGAIQLIKNPRFHDCDRTKHINIRYHELGSIAIDNIPSPEMTADIMTKLLPKETDCHHMEGLGLRIEKQSIIEQASEIGKVSEIKSGQYHSHRRKIKSWRRRHLLLHNSKLQDPSISDHPKWS